jgi:hypothetical protein
MVVKDLIRGSVAFKRTGGSEFTNPIQQWTVEV